MNKHRSYATIQQSVGSVPRADEFIQLLGNGEYRHPSEIHSKHNGFAIEVAETYCYRDGEWTKYYRALVCGKQVLCVYIAHNNNTHSSVARIARHVLNI